MRHRPHETHVLEVLIEHRFDAVPGLCESHERGEHGLRHEARAETRDDEPLERVGGDDDGRIVARRDVREDEHDGRDDLARLARAQGLRDVADTPDRGLRRCVRDR